MDISPVDGQGIRFVRYSLDDETFTHPVQVAEPTSAGSTGLELASKNNPCHVGSPSAGDLWVMYVKPGDIVKKDEELFNITIMKQEKAVKSPMNGIVERVLKSADYRTTKQMIPVREGELLVVLAPVPKCCDHCKAPIKNETYKFCPVCGGNID